MSRSLDAAGSILTPEGWVKGRVQFAKGRITAIEGRAIPAGAKAEPPFIVPGFIDLHVHGGLGADVMEGEAQVRRTLRFHAAHGTVAMTPSTVTAPVPAIEAALSSIVAVQKRGETGEAAVLGVHLEGPFINPGRLGAQAPYPHEGDPELATRWAERYPITIATVAPEIKGGIETIKALAGHRCRVQVGHTLATQDQVGLAFACGCTGFTHLFNAMTGVHHRDPGVATWALAHGEYAEIICDLNHIHPNVILAARRSIPKLYTVTDAASAAGMPDGEYRLGELKVTKRGLKVTLEDNVTLASSVITLADAVANLVSIGVPLAEAVTMASTRPADYLGISDLGRIALGARASLVRLDSALKPEAVWIDGEGIDVAA